MSDRTYLIDHTSERYILFSKGSQGGQYIYSKGLIDHFLDGVIFHNKLELLSDDCKDFDRIFEEYENYSKSTEWTNHIDEKIERNVHR